MINYIFYDDINYIKGKYVTIDTPFQSITLDLNDNNLREYIFFNNSKIKEDKNDILDIKGDYK